MIEWKPKFPFLLSNFNHLNRPLLRTLVSVLLKGLSFNLYWLRKCVSKRLRDRKPVFLYRWHRAWCIKEQAKLLIVLILRAYNHSVMKEKLSAQHTLTHQWPLKSKQTSQKSMWPEPEPLCSSFHFRDGKAQNIVAQPVFTQSRWITSDRRL